jgi:hypothetical protein
MMGEYVPTGRLMRFKVSLTLVVTALTASIAHAGHERFTVGEMRDVDPSAIVITSISGACIPSHDREKMECYFTSFALWRTKTPEQIKKEEKDERDLEQELKKDAAKMIKDMKKTFCEEKTAPDPLVLKYNVPARTLFAAVKDFCGHPTRDSALGLVRAVTRLDERKCSVAVTDWRSTFLRQGDRWVENTGPSGLCGVINVSTLVPQDAKKIDTPTGPVLWTLNQKTITTHGADNELCAKSLFKIEEGAITLSWNAPSKSIECGEMGFTSALKGMSDPRKK